MLGLIRDLLLRRHRSFRKDARDCISTLDPSLNLLGSENIPQSGPCLITFNHYSRPGFNSWWNALAITAQLPMETHIIMTGELTFPGKWYAPVGKPLSLWALKKIAKTYGFTSMPPMPPREKDVSARAQSVRQVLSYVEKTQDPVVCLAPEGGDMPGGRLAYPPLGAGRFMAHLAKKGLKVIPVGVFEQEGFLCVHFGLAYELAIRRSFPSDHLDHEIARKIMKNIAPLLPPQLRGEFQ
jgi:hypothetical protein